MAESTFTICAKFMQARANVANQIRAIAFEFGEKLPDDFELIHFLDLPLELMTKIVVKLIATKCSSPRREEEDMKVLMLTTLQLYLAMRPRKVDLTALLSFCPKRLKYQYFKKSVEKISEMAADIEELSLVHTEKYGNRFCVAVDDEDFDELLRALGKLKRLKVLRIEEICQINLNDLIKLCQNLPDLEYLHFNIGNDTDQIDFEDLNFAEKLKSAMPKLKVFLFDTTGEVSVRSAFIKCCTDNLSNLRVIQNFSSRFSSFEDYESSNEITQASGSSNLRHLTVKYDFVESCTPLPTAYPLITHLKILWKPYADIEEKDLIALLQLTHLESLEFFNVPQNIFHLFVNKFGPNLREISISYDYVDEDDDDDDEDDDDDDEGADDEGADESADDDDEGADDEVADDDGDDEMVEYNVSTDYSLGQLLALCPKLERLAFRANFKVDPEPIAFSSNLKEIRVEFWSEYNAHIPLIDILRAPNLEKLTYVECKFDFEDLRSVSTMIKEKTILRKLKELHLVIFSSIDTFDAEYFKETAAFIKCCVAASPPDISVITLHIFHDGLFIDYAPLARSLSNGKTTNDEINGITQFCENQTISSEFIELFVDEELIFILQKYKR